ncbi:UV-stimulated scaffold protein A homolog [Nymphaea colorata]|nr:UV-stimulated scaffold protein A homolog [Nymphaea colorata]
MGSEGGKLRSLIEKATHSTSREVDVSILRSIKHMVRSSDDNARAAAEALLEIMKKNHSQVRYLALLIVDELFMRSKLFRSCVVVDFNQFLSLSVGFRRSCPLPPPLNVASTLRAKSLEFLEKWNNSFGLHYRQLRLGLDYLKNTLHFHFPNVRERAARSQQERREREARSQEILRTKFENLRNNYSSITEEIQSAIVEMEECMHLLHVSKVEDGDEFTDFPHDTVEEFGSLNLRKIRLDSIKEGKRICEDSDNRPIFDALRELYKVLILRHLKTVQEWLSVLVRVDGVDARFRDSALKQFIDVRNCMQTMKKKCEELGCVLPDVSDVEDGILWEEGKIKADSPEVETETNRLPENSYGSPAKEDMVREEAANVPKDSNDETLKEKGETSDSTRKRLLDEAPVVKWGSYLDNWGTKRDFLANQRGLEVEGHWGRVDYDATIPAEKIAELSVQATVYKEEQVQIQPCLAPLKKGGLCQRQDLKVCPFHGPIIPRDSEGNPLELDQSKGDPISDGEGTSREESPLPVNITPEQIARQAVKNVRKKDKEKEREKQNQQAHKREKLAKVREHNAAVLRELAMASTSQGLGESLGEDIEGFSHNVANQKSKKETLASMLRKKTTRRDRLAQRLLNSQATDATIRQMTEADDVSYREAYPNQW